MGSKKPSALIALLILFTSALGKTDDLDVKLKPVFQYARELAAIPAVIADVQESNKAMPKEYVGMTQAKWKRLRVIDPLVIYFTQTKSALALKEKQKLLVSEAFISNAKGLKVGFLAKTSNWSHQGKPKHDEPMKNHEWTGKPELDESSGTHQVQISVPILNQGKPIGSLVLGIAVSRL